MVRQLRKLEDVVDIERVRDGRAAFAAMERYVS
jgi:hypothetical protein